MASGAWEGVRHDRNSSPRGRRQGPQVRHRPGRGRRRPRHLARLGPSRSRSPRTTPTTGPTWSGPASAPASTSRSSPARAASTAAGSRSSPANSRFLAGSIGVAAGERLVRAVERATAERLPLLAAPASGGTRMQEGTVAFLQMVKVAAAITDHKAAGLPYLVYLRHPTTGGVLASWGSLGHVTAAEPGALIGFLGPRVHEALYGEEFPAGRPGRREPDGPRPGRRGAPGRAASPEVAARVLRRPVRRPGAPAGGGFRPGAEPASPAPSPPAPRAVGAAAPGPRRSGPPPRSRSGPRGGTTGPGVRASAAGRRGRTYARSAAPAPGSTTPGCCSPSPGSAGALRGARPRPARAPRRRARVGRAARGRAGHRWGPPGCARRGAGCASPPNWACRCSPSSTPRAPRSAARPRRAGWRGRSPAASPTW